MASVRVLLVLVVALTFGFARDVLAQSPPIRGWTEARFQPLAERLNGADARVTLLEGLPHQLVEHSSFLQERDRKNCVEIGGYYFYKKPLPLAPPDGPSLRAIASELATYHPYSGPKRCGGFHPDYALRWGDGRDAVYTLICFGCHETQTLGREDYLIADLPEPAYRQLEAALGKRRSQRPPFRKG